jgi:hypothetical protein
MVANSEKGLQSSRSGRSEGNLVRVIFPTDIMTVKWYGIYCGGIGA